LGSTSLARRSSSAPHRFAAAAATRRVAASDRTRRQQRARGRLPVDRARAGDPRSLPRARSSAHLEGERPAWLLWPVAFFARGDALTLSHAAWLEQTAIDPILDRTVLAGGYNATRGDAVRTSIWTVIRVRPARAVTWGRTGSFP
jgi:hypothetical protein